MGIGRFSLSWCWAEAPISHELLARCLPHFLWCGLCHTVSCTMAKLVRGQGRAPSRDNANKMEVIVFCNPITEVTLHQFCHIPVIISKSLGSAPTQGKGVGQECAYYWVLKFAGSYLRWFSTRSYIFIAPRNTELDFIVF